MEQPVGVRVLVRGRQGRYGAVQQVSTGDPFQHRRTCCLLSVVCSSLSCAAPCRRRSIHRADQTETTLTRRGQSERHLSLQAPNNLLMAESGVSCEAAWDTPLDKSAPPASTPQGHPHAQGPAPAVARGLAVLCPWAGVLEGLLVHYPAELTRTSGQRGAAESATAQRTAR